MQTPDTATDSQDLIARSLAEQFDRLWSSMRDALAKCPDDQWRQGDVDWLIPARLAVHAIQACDFYSGENPDSFDWNALGCSWEDSKPEALPSRDATLEYLDRVVIGVRTWLADLGDAGLLQEEKHFPWTGRLIMDRAIYSVRHAQHHLGQINAELRRRDLPRGEWA